MGLFRGMINAFHKSKASVIIQKLLEQDMRSGLIDAFNPIDFANQIIDAAWYDQPEYFDGSVGGVRPNNMSLATFSLAWSIAHLSADSQRRRICLMPFTRLIREVYERAALYNFNSLDNMLLDYSFGVFEALDDGADFVDSQRIRDLVG